MTPAVTALLLGGTMALSLLALVVSNAGCDCPMNWCVEAWVPDAGTCCSVAEPYYYDCDVELEGPHKAEYTAVAIGACFAGADEAEANAPFIAQEQNPGKFGRSAACVIASCPVPGAGGAP